MDMPLLTKRGRQKFAKDGYMYNFDKLSQDGTKKMWRCDQKSTQKCPVRIHTDLAGENVLQMKNTHSHGSDAALVEVAKIKAEIKRKAKETFETPEEILESILSNTTEAILGHLPNLDAIRNTVQRARNAITCAATPPVPRSLQNLQDVPNEYRNYEMAPGEWEPFLLADAACDANLRILIFGRQSCITWLDEMHELCIDGAFKAKPPLFRHVYVISANRSGFVMPVLYVLLPNKQRITFDTLFETIKLVLPDIRPVSISVDLEMEIVNSLQAAFPEAKISSSLFHLAHSLQNLLNETGLYTRYANDVEFALRIRMILALAFVPVHELDIAFGTLCNHVLAKMPELAPTLDWFEDNFLGRPNFSGGRRTAIFHKVAWSLNQRMLDNHGERDDQAGACHRRVQAQLGISRTSIWKFIDGLKTVQKDEDKLYEQYQSNEPQPKRNKYARSYMQLLNVVRNNTGQDQVDFLTSVAQYTSL